MARPFSTADTMEPLLSLSHVKLESRSRELAVESQNHLFLKEHHLKVSRTLFFGHLGRQEASDML